MTKLTPAQAYALQVKADRRSAALDRRENAAVVAVSNKPVVQYVTVKPDAKRIPYSTDELRPIVAEYLATNGDFSKANIKALEKNLNPNRKAASGLRGVWSQIRCLDSEHSYVNFVRHGRTLKALLSISNELLGYDRFIID